MTDQSHDVADHWLLRTPGSCFRSSVGKRVVGGRRSNLTVIERRRFGDVTYLEDAR